MTSVLAIQFTTHLKVWVGDHELIRDPGREWVGNGSGIEDRVRAKQSKALIHGVSSRAARKGSIARKLELVTIPAPSIGLNTLCQSCGSLEATQGFAAERSIAGERFSIVGLVSRTYALSPEARS
jgi:hypothetical protein